MPRMIDEPYRGSKSIAVIVVAIVGTFALQPVRTPPLLGRAFDQHVVDVAAAVAGAIAFGTFVHRYLTGAFMFSFERSYILNLSAMRII